MLVGDRVHHLTFPPLDGTVLSITNQFNGNKIGVRLDSGKIFYDMEDTWEVSSSSYKRNDAIDIDFEVVKD
jgi:hypothetical protein